jgi:hypothetical protein
MCTVAGIALLAALSLFISYCFGRAAPWCVGPDRVLIGLFGLILWPVFLFLMLRNRESFGYGVDGLAAWAVAGTVATVCLVPDTDISEAPLVLICASALWLIGAYALLKLVKYLTEGLSFVKKKHPA